MQWHHLLLLCPFAVFGAVIEKKHTAVSHTDTVFSIQLQLMDKDAQLSEGINYQTSPEFQMQAELFCSDIKQLFAGIPQELLHFEFCNVAAFHIAKEDQLNTESTMVIDLTFQGRVYDKFDLIWETITDNAGKVDIEGTEALLIGGLPVGKAYQKVDVTVWVNTHETPSSYISRKSVNDHSKRVLTRTIYNKNIDESRFEKSLVTDRRLQQIEQVLLKMQRKQHLENEGKRDYSDQEMMKLLVKLKEQLI